jgi:hypothetical protein
MDEKVREFLDQHHLTSRWLDDIIDVVMRFRGTAHVRTIASELSKSYGRDIDTGEETVTRRINDFCSDAPDFDKPPKYDLFKRVEPATYRPRDYPTKLNIIELVQIKFEELVMQGMWRWFAKECQKKNRKGWSAASNEKKLTAFVKCMSTPAVFREYQRRQQALDAMPSPRARADPVRHPHPWVRLPCRRACGLGAARSSHG